MSTALLDLVRKLRPEQYWYTGAQYLAEPPSQARPLEVSCTLLAQGKERLVLEGTYRHLGHSTSHPFEVTISFEPSPVCELNSSHTGLLSGRLYEVGGEYVVVMAGSNGHAFSCHLTISEDGRVHAKGALKAGELRFGYLANGAPGPERESLGNVVGVLGGRRIA